MASARELFLAHVRDPELDPEVAELRRGVERARLEIADQLHGLDASGLKLVMPGLYQQTISAMRRIAGKVGVEVALALEVCDEARSGVSSSTLSREIRDEMRETAIAAKQRATDAVTRVITEVEANRLAWRHSHEFLSWLGFRRQDPRFPADDRYERMLAFKVHQRLLVSRHAVGDRLGAPLAIALEAHDRFMLQNRWLLDPTDEHRVEAAVWATLSYQPRQVVLLELERAEYDRARKLGHDEPALAARRARIYDLLVDQLAQALSGVAAR